MEVTVVGLLFILSCWRTESLQKIILVGQLCVGNWMFCHGSIFVLISFLVPQRLDLFLDWYVYLSIRLLQLILFKCLCYCSGKALLNSYFLQVQSLPRMIIMDEIGKQVRFFFGLIFNIVSLKVVRNQLVS
jgi:hypothetical protein